MNRKTVAAASDTASIVNDVRRIVRVLREASRAIEQSVGLSGAQLFVLRVLADQPAMSLNELAARTLTHQSTVSVVVRRLVDAELVRREVSAEDARRVVLALTPEGKALIRRAPGAGQERLFAGIARLSESERGRLSVLMSRLVEEMDIGQRAAPMFFEDPPTARRPRSSRG